jgi:hypothetical protein
MSLSFAVTISDDCGAVGAAFGAGEQPAFAPKCKSAKGFGGIVHQTYSSIAKATRKVVPALEHVIDWLSNRGAARDKRDRCPRSHASKAANTSTNLICCGSVRSGPDI